MYVPWCLFIMVIYFLLKFAHAEHWGLQSPVHQAGLHTNRSSKSMQDRHILKHGATGWQTCNLNSEHAAYSECYSDMRWCDLLPLLSVCFFVSYYSAGTAVTHTHSSLHLQTITYKECVHYHYTHSHPQTQTLMHKGISPHKQFVRDVDTQLWFTSFSISAHTRAADCSRLTPLTSEAVSELLSWYSVAQFRLTASVAPETVE